MEIEVCKKTKKDEQLLHEVQKKCTRLENLFDGYQFKFEGLNEERVKDLTRLVEELGAKVTNDAVLILTDLNYFLKPQNIKRRDLIEWGIIRRAVEDQGLPNFEEYRFINYRILNLSANSEKDRSEINGEYSSKDSAEYVPEENVEGIAKENVEDIAKENMEDIAKENVEDIAKENVEDIAKENVEDIAKGNVEDIAKGNRKNANKKITSYFQSNIAQKLTSVPDSSSKSQLDFDSEEENEYFHKIWWKRYNVPVNLQCRRNSCTFLPYPHESHCHASDLKISLFEKKIILRYMIENNAISVGKGNKIYEVMRKSGHLTHRSEETLRNCFRRYILTHLKPYNLPRHIVRRLEAVRDKKK